MKVLGISGRERQAAAALSIDGALVAAAHEDSFVRIPQVGYRHTGGYPVCAVAACLARGGVTLAQIDQMAVADDDQTGEADPTAADEGMGHAFWADGHQALKQELRGRTWLNVAPALADARQLAAVHGDELIILVLSSGHSSASVFHQRGSEITPALIPAGVDQLLCATRRMVEVLGLGSRSDYRAIERLGAGANAEPGAFAQAMAWHPERGVLVNDDLFAQAIEGLRTAGVRLERERQALAAGFCARVRQVVVEIGAGLLAGSGVARLGLAGDFFASPSVAAAMCQAFGDRVVLAPVPEAAGRAIGAVWSGASNGRLNSLALGPEFAESEIKLALENCRLDYLYEPDWPRLLGRVSRLLSGGSVVAWFQGAAGFGPRPIGTRAILADPSNRYARDNINRFLRHGSVEDPLPLSMTAAAMRDCLDSPLGSPFHLLESGVNAQCRDKLRGALDHRHMAPIQMVTSEQSQVFFDLLELHRARTDVPGLISTTLNGVGEPAACTPRDAIRTMFSSAIDAFVIGRFLLMKDYWLLRSTPEA